MSFCLLNQACCLGSKVSSTDTRDLQTILKMQQNASEVYNKVMEHVIEEIQGVFQQEAIDSSVLQELRDSWSRKLQETDTVSVESTTAPTEAMVELTAAAAAAGVRHGMKSNNLPNSAILQNRQQQYQQQQQHFSSIPPTEFQGNNNQEYPSVFCPYPAGASPSLPLHYNRTDGDAGRYGPRAGDEGYLAQSRYSPWVQGAYPTVGQTSMLNNMPSFHRQSLGGGGGRTGSGGTNRRSVNGICNPLAAIDDLYSGTQSTTTTTNAVILQSRSTPLQTPPLTSQTRHIQMPNSKTQIHVQPSIPAQQGGRTFGKRKDLQSINGSQMNELPSSSMKTPRLATKTVSSRTIPQHDGSKDEIPSAVVVLNDSNSLDRDSDDDDDDDIPLSDVDDEDDSIDSANCLIAQYDKVSRIKNRWRCTLKHGIFSINGQDYLFKNANGEFTF